MGDPMKGKIVFVWFAFVVLCSFSVAAIRTDCLSAVWPMNDTVDQFSGVHNLTLYGLASCDGEEVVEYEK